MNRLLFLLIALLLFSNSYLQSQIQPDTIKTIDPYDEIVWEVQTPGQVYDVAYHPNGKYVFALDDKVVQMFNASDGSLVKEMGRGLSFSFTDMDLSKDGKLVATCGYLDKIIIFDLETGKEKIRLYDTLFGFTEYRSVSFSPDGKKLVVTAGKSFYGSGVLLFDVETEKRLASTYNQVLPPLYDKKDFKDYVTAIFIPDTDTILTVCYSNSKMEKTDINLKVVQSQNIYIATKPTSNKTIIKFNPNERNFFLIFPQSQNLYSLDNLKPLEIFSDKPIMFDVEFDKYGTKLIFGKITLDVNLNVINQNIIYNIANKKNQYSYSYKEQDLGFLTSSFNYDFVLNGISDKLKLIKVNWDSQTLVNNNQFTFNILSVYPNPTNNLLNANITSQTFGNIKFEILNLTSQSVFTQMRAIVEGESNLVIPINNIPNGAYIFRATLNNSTKQINFIINR